MEAKLITFVIFVVYLKTVLATDTIRAVGIVFRHGDRAPSQSYPLDPYANYQWPGGYGALSPRGAKQLRDSGKVQRRRFDTLMTENNDFYSTDNMYVRSSAVPRCIASGENFLAGFLPPPVNPTNPVTWQPVSISSIPVTEDNMLAQNKICPSYDYSLQEAFRLDVPEVNALLKGDESDFFEFLRNNTGLPINSLLEMLLIADTLKVQQDNELTWPNWVYSVYDEFVRPLGDLAYIRYGQAKTMKLNGGSLLSDILDNLHNFVSGSQKNILVYSAHDITVISLLSALEVIDQAAAVPKYASLITVELHENAAIANDLEIRLFYFADETVEDPIEIVIPNCTAPCSLEQFTTVVQPILVPNYDLKCNEDVKKFFNQQMMIF